MADRITRVTGTVGKVSKHVKLRSADIDRDSLRSYVQQALELDATR